MKVFCLISFSAVDAIKIDLPRTFPDNIFFEGIKYKLLNILMAYAQHNKEIGYCQGLNYIAGETRSLPIGRIQFAFFHDAIIEIAFEFFLGLILIVTKNEEWTFWLLKVLIENTIQSYHTKTMTGLIIDIDVLRQLLESRVPDVCKHLDYCSLPTAVIATKWFICLFAEVLPIETVLRIWDCLFFEGNKVRHIAVILTLICSIWSLAIRIPFADSISRELDIDRFQSDGNSWSRRHNGIGQSTPLNCQRRENN